MFYVAYIIISLFILLLLSFTFVHIFSSEFHSVTVTFMIYIKKMKSTSIIKLWFSRNFHIFLFHTLWNFLRKFCWLCQDFTQINRLYIFRIFTIIIFSISRRNLCNLCIYFFIFIQLNNFHFPAISAYETSSHYNFLCFYLVFYAVYLFTYLSVYYFSFTYN